MIGVVPLILLRPPAILEVMAIVVVVLLVVLPVWLLVALLVVVVRDVLLVDIAEVAIEDRPVVLAKMAVTTDGSRGRRALHGPAPPEHGRGRPGARLFSYTSKERMDQNVSWNFLGCCATHSLHVKVSDSSGHACLKTLPAQSPQKVVSKTKRMSTKWFGEQATGLRVK